MKENFIKKNTPEQNEDAKKVWAKRMQVFVEDGILSEEVVNDLINHLNDPEKGVDQEFKKKLLGALEKRQNLLLSFLNDDDSRLPEEAENNIRQAIKDINDIFIELKNF